VFARALRKDVTEVLEVIGVRAYAVKGLHAWGGEGAALDRLRGTAGEARRGGVSLRRALFLDGDGDLGNGVGDDVE
jgi:hypothetical protein